jgi:hypothetical protein
MTDYIGRIKLTSGKIIHFDFSSPYHIGYLRNHKKGIVENSEHYREIINDSPDYEEKLEIFQK